jgi:ribosome-associated protein
MANEFVLKEVKKIYKAQSDSSKANALAAAWIIANYKGINIKAYDVHETSSLCDYNLIATALNPTQAKTMADEIQYNIKQNGGDIISVEGLTDNEWVLIDAGDVIIHIFQEISRDVFDLDSLWHEFPQLEIPSDYYFSNPEMNDSDESTQNYF